jgi:hypothetical protein
LAFNFDQTTDANANPSNLEPGGYFELHDNVFPPISDDRSLAEDSPIVNWCNLMTEGAAKLGRSINDALKYHDWMIDAGFEDVTTKIYKWPINRWPKDPHYKELGAWTLTAMDTGLEGLCMAVFTRAHEWDQEKVLSFCSEVRKDLRNLENHAYWKM